MTANIPQSKLILLIPLLLIVSVTLSMSVIPAYADDSLDHPNDGMDTWTMLTGNSNFIVQNIDFLDEDNGLIVGSGMEFTKNGGNTWNELDFSALISSEVMTSVSMYDVLNGIAVTDRGKILYTNNGATWNIGPSMNIELELPTSHELTTITNLYDVVMTSPTDAWVIGDKILIYTSDGGVTWTRTAIDPLVPYFDLSFADSDFAFASGRYGNVIAIDTITKTFTQLTSPTTLDINGLYLAADKMTAFVGDEEGYIYHTTNGGDTWVFHQRIPDANWSQDQIFEIHFADENNGWLSTGGGRVYATTDGGNYWLQQLSLEPFTATGLDIVNDKVWAVFGSDGIWGFTIPDNYDIPFDDTTPNLNLNRDHHLIDDDGTTKKSGGGCNDCTPPTLGLDDNSRRVVDNGFSYNGNSIQAEKYHTPYPLINATVGEMNKVEITVYENGGINNMNLVQFGLGATEIGQPISELEVLIEVWLSTTGTIDSITVDEIVIRDSDNLIDNDSVSAVSYVTPCQSTDLTPNCVKVDLQYSYREATINNVMVVAVSDKKHNNQNFYFNHGIQVLGESLNEPPTYTISNKYHSQQTEDLYLTLTRADKVNHIWIDENGIEYFQVSESRFDRITPVPKYSCSDDELVIKSVAKRNNICQFLPLINYEIARAENVMNEMYLVRNSDGIEEFNHNGKLFRQYE